MQRSPGQFGEKVWRVPLFLRSRLFFPYSQSGVQAFYLGIMTAIEISVIECIWAF